MTRKESLRRRVEVEENVTLAILVVQLLMCMVRTCPLWQQAHEAEALWEHNTENGVTTMAAAPSACNKTLAEHRCRAPARAHRTHRHQLASSVAPAQHHRSVHVKAQVAQLRPEECARMLYEDVWSHGRVRLLDTIMAEDHQQRDMVSALERRVEAAMRTTLATQRMAARRAGAGVAAATRGPRRGGPPADEARRFSVQVGERACCTEPSAHGCRICWQWTRRRQAYPDIRFDIHLLACPCPMAAGSDPSSRTAEDGHQPAQQAQQAQHLAAGSAAAGRQQHEQPPGPQGAVVVVHWSAEGHNLGPIRGTPPTGR